MNFNHQGAATADNRAGQQLLGPSDVANWLGVSAGWVRDHATRKYPRIKGIKVGKLLRFRREDIEDFLSNSIEDLAQKDHAQIQLRYSADLERKEETNQ